jgi:hypothetical protein
MSKALPPELLGISKVTHATWDDLLPRDPRLLVPIHLDVLLVRDDGVARADCAFRRTGARDGDASQPGSALDALPPAFTDAAPRARGAYLLWAVPDALAVVGSSSAAPTPGVLPDRWLVVRTFAGAHGAPTHRAWVIDARAGTATDLSAWRATPPSGQPLTALGAGDAGWIAYADNTLNRLGFHDPLDVQGQGAASWIVCGWYADPAQDPLATPRPRSAKELDARLAELRWSLDARDLQRAHELARAAAQRAVAAGLPSTKTARRPDGTIYHADEPAPFVKGRPAGGVKLATTVGPTACLFHGALVNAGWPHALSAPESAPPPSSGEVRVALGLTPAEAFSTFVGDEGEMLTAFALGAAADLHRPDGRVLVADRLHDAGFAARPGGSDAVSRTPIETKLPPVKARPVVAKTKEKRWSVAPKASLDRSVLVPAAEPTRTDVTLPKARWFLPADPVIAVMGGRRSFRQGGDGRFTPDGTLACRLTGSVVSALSVSLRADLRVSITADEVRAWRIDHGGVPPECDSLVAEQLLLDPSFAPAIAERARLKAGLAQAQAADVRHRVEVEQTAWWAMRKLDSDSAALLAHSGIDGTLPSPVALRPAQAPWVPLHVDWEIEYLKVPHAAWTLGEIDFAPPPVPEGADPPVRGRSLLSAGPAKALALSLRTLADHVRASGTSAASATGTAAAGAALLDGADPDPAALDELAERLSALDVLGGSLEHLHLLLRQRVSVEPASPPPAAPPDFVALRSGFARVRRLRLVDAFGQFVDLLPDARPLELAASLRIDGAPRVAALPPRFTAPAQLSFRFVDAAARTVDASLERSPVCGWLLPDHLDGALEVFEGDGTPKGQLRALADGGTAWEPAPGLPVAIGASPAETVLHPALRALVTSLHDAGRRDAVAGRESALSSLLRVVDTTRWTVDPFGQVGEEHLALLLGHPIAVVAATLRLSVDEPVAGSAAADARVPVRLGALSHWRDGLFAFLVDDEKDRIRVAAAAAELARAVPATAGPDTAVDHPIFDTSQLLWVVPNRTYALLLLMEPHTSVHATSGLLPRKELGLRREWMAAPLGVLAPTFRFGPVLRDPAQVRMPIPADLGGAWTWTHRADVDRWAADEAVVHTSGEALFSPQPATLEEGWLRFAPGKAGGS